MTAERAGSQREHRKVTLLTASYLPDLPRVELLLHSTDHAGLELPHVIVVHTEDVDDFQRRLRRANVTIVCTEDVLPADIERRRRSVPRRWNPRRWVEGASIAGWTSQQLVKLAAPLALDLDVAVVVDSEFVFLRHVDEASFLDASGRPLLFESVDDDALTMEWAVEAMRFLRLDRGGRVLRQYIHVPAVLDSRTISGLRTFLEQCHGREWLDAFMESRTTEYMLYGTYARHLAAGTVVPHAPLPSAVIWAKPDGDVATALERMVRDTKPVVMGVQSTVGLSADELREIYLRVRG